MSKMMRRVVMLIIVLSFVSVAHVVLSMKYWRTDWSVRLYWRLHGVEVNACFQGSPRLEICQVGNGRDLSLIRQFPELTAIYTSHHSLDMKDLVGFRHLTQLDLGCGELLNFEMLTNHLDIWTVDCGVGRPIRDTRLRERFSGNMWNATLLLRPDNVDEVLACREPELYRRLDVADCDLKFLTDDQVVELRKMKFASIGACRMDVFWENFDARRSKCMRRRGDGK